MNNRPFQHHNQTPSPYTPHGRYMQFGDPSIPFSLRSFENPAQFELPIPQVGYCLPAEEEMLIGSFLVMQDHWLSLSPEENAPLRLIVQKMHWLSATTRQVRPEMMAGGGQGLRPTIAHIVSLTVWKEVLVEYQNLQSTAPYLNMLLSTIDESLKKNEAALNEMIALECRYRSEEEKASAVQHATTVVERTEMHQKKAWEAYNLWTAGNTVLVKCLKAYQRTAANFEIPPTSDGKTSTEV